MKTEIKTEIKSQKEFALAFLSFELVVYTDALTEMKNRTISSSDDGYVDYMSDMFFAEFVVHTIEYLINMVGEADD